MPSGIRKRRAAKQRVTKKPTRRATKKGHSKQVVGNALISENWDTNLTLAQNYKNLGLASKLQNPAGGTEKPLFDEEQSTIIKKKTVQTARIVTDADGNTQIVYNDEQPEEDVQQPEYTSQESKWLYAGLSRAKSSNPIVQQLEEQAKHGAVDARHQSERELDWLEKLVAKHGDDYHAMQWDKKLNKFQQSAGDLKRRIRKAKLN